MAKVSIRIDLDGELAEKFLALKQALNMSQASTTTAAKSFENANDKRGYYTVKTRLYRVLE